MNVTERKMLNATMTGRPFHSVNTDVKIDPDTNSYSVFLYGYLIAEGTIGERPHHFNMCGWGTRTTQSRLNALGAGVYRKNWEWNCPVSGWFTKEDLVF